MALEFPSGLNALIASGWCRVHPFIEITLADGTSKLKYSTVDVTVGGHVYVARLKKISGGKISLTKAIDRLFLTFWNADALVGQALVIPQLTRARAVVGLLYLNIKDPSEGYRVEADDGVVTANSAGDHEAEGIFISSTHANESLMGDLPVLKTCAHRYRSPECGYTGDLPSCDQTFDGINGCRAHFTEEESVIQFGGHALFVDDSTPGVGNNNNGGGVGYPGGIGNNDDDIANRLPWKDQVGGLFYS